MSAYPEASLATNIPQGYKCRWVYLKSENKGKCVFTSKIPKGKVLTMPIAHGEGTVPVSQRKRSTSFLRSCTKRTCWFSATATKNGDYAEGEYPTNPNGSFHDIAGICNREGTIFGLMPHPERALYWWQQPDWTRQETDAAVRRRKTDIRKRNRALNQEALNP